MPLISSCIEETDSGIKVTGDLGDFQVVEEKSESDEEIERGSRTVSTVFKLPQDIVKPSASVFGSVSVENSENVQFGNNTYFNGPVTIKQVVHHPEHDNAGYEHTEGDASYVPPKAESKIEKDYSIKQLEIKFWLKVSVLAASIIVIVGICTVLSITLTNQPQSSSSPFNKEEKAANCPKVEGLYHHHDIYNLKLLIPYLLVALITFVWFFLVLTKETVVVKKNGETKKEKNNNNAYNVDADPLLIAPNHLRIVARTDWLAKPVEQALDPLRLPAPWVIITHTDTENCTYQSECVLRVRLIQTFHVESRKWFDIGYNFLVAGDGSAYWGRGWDSQGAHTLGYNKYSIGIAFVGTFNNYPPPKKQIEACQKLIKRGVELEKIAKDYKLFGHRQLASTVSPGDKLFDIIKEWPHFVNNVTDIAELVPNY